VLRCADLPGVGIELADLKESMPADPFDLIVFSDIGCNFPREKFAVIAQQLAVRLVAGGELLAVHWLGDTDDRGVHGDVTHQLLIEQKPA
jgi:hypothetical protein